MLQGLKPGRLTPEEFETIKGHTTIGQRMLAGSSDHTLQMGASVALNHHERWDGGGYPAGLKGEDIPIEGRIVIIVDQYDALRSKRPYKAGFSHAESLKIINEGEGRTMPEHFDPDVLSAVKRASQEFEEIFDAHQE